MHKSDYRALIKENIKIFPSDKQIERYSVLCKRKTNQDQIETNGNPTSIFICNKDTLECARDVHFKGHPNLLVLNNASAKNPGGGALNGSVAQEEVLCYKSTYILSLHPDFNKDTAKFYPMRPNNAIYSPNVLVIRDEYFNLSDPKDRFPVSILACPAINKNNKPSRWTDDERDLAKEKIRLIFDVAIKYEHKVLILGAWGCGVFNNDPRAVAKAFLRILEVKTYKNRFEVIYFAILNNQSGKQTSNFQIFKEVLKG